MKKLLPIFFIFSCCVLFAQNVKLGGNTVISGNVSIGSTGNAIVLSSISISPANPVIPYTQSQIFTALGTYSNGSQSDITTQASWFSSNMAVATNNGNTFQCVSRGTTNVTAVLSGVTSAIDTLGCQSPTFTPTGNVNVPQGNVSIVIQNYTAANGTSPYTFSSPDLPAWTSLGNTGCAANQINCALIGIPSTLGTYNFHLQASDNIGNSSCASPGCPVSVTVTTAGAEDNTYCSLVGGVETVVGHPYDPPSNPITVCNYTALAWTTLGATPYIINVCPVGQLDSTGVHDTGCQNAPQPPSLTCNTVGGIFCATIQGALNYAYNNGPCGADIQIWPTINDNDPTSAQNVYTEPTVNAIGNINCGPDYNQPWMYIRTRKYASLPPPGNRISPAWINVSSINGYPHYAQTSTFGISAGTYLPKWRCEIIAGPTCRALLSQMNTATIGGILSGVRIMGIEFTAPYGRNATTDLYGNPVCFGGNCAPGFIGTIVSIGCELIFNNPCSGATGVQGNPPATPTGTGSQHVIVDRNVFFGCEDVTQVNCVLDAEDLLKMENGQHLSAIDNYLIGGYCMYTIGPCVDSKAIGGGNPNDSLNDIGLKYVNNFLAAAGENIFWGGGSASFIPMGIEVRRNHMYKPLFWKADDPSFSGQIYDGWVNKGGSGYLSGLSGNLTCTVDPPQISGVQATCNGIVTNGVVTDIQITGHGSGYGLIYKSNGKTAPIGRAGIYFTDNNGITYTSCQLQLSGDVTTNGTTDVKWADGNKFRTILNGTQLTINSINYTVASVNSLTDLTTTTVVPSSGSGIYPYSSNLPSRGDCVYTINGVPDIKNLSEFKNGQQVIWEGNIEENNWLGQSDQTGNGILLTPKNPNNLCPNCSVQDFTARYNFFRNMNNGAQIAQAGATQGGTLPLYLNRVIFHDNIFDNMNSVYWTAGTAPIPSGGITGFSLLDVNAQSLAVNNITINHNLFLGTLPTGYSNTGGALGKFIFGGAGGLALMTNIVITNNIGAGGMKNFSGLFDGFSNCLNNSCSDQNGNFPTAVAIRQATPNSYDGPISAGVYSTGQFGRVQITTPGTCSVVPNGYTLSGGGGTGGSIGFNTSLTAGKAITKAWVQNIGQGYTTAPVITITGGTCSVQPVLTLTILGNGLPQNTAACFDHNIMPTQAWTNITAMIPYPTTQMDTNNNCISQAGGGNNTQPNSTVGYNVCNGVVGNPGTGPCSWADVGFTNLVLDGNNAELVGTTGDLHLTSSSLGHGAGNDGLDIGPNVDLVLGTQSGTPSQYTGISLSGGVAIIPQ